MKKKLRKALMALLVLILAGSGAVIVRNQIDDRVGDQAYETAGLIAGLT